MKKDGERKRREGGGCCRRSSVRRDEGWMPAGVSRSGDGGSGEGNDQQILGGAARLGVVYTWESRPNRGKQGRKESEGNGLG